MLELPQKHPWTQDGGTMKLYRSPLSLIFLFVPLVNLCQTAWGQNEIRCEMRDQFLLNFRNESADQLCPQVRPSECQAIIERIRKASNELRAKLTEVCDGVNGLEGRLSKIAGQRDHYTAAANILGQTSNSYGSYLSLLQASYNSLGASMGAADGLLFDLPRKILRETIGKKIRFYDTYYEFDHVRVEHGHMHEAINATDPQKFVLRDPDYPEPVLNLPWASLFVAMFLPKIKKERPFVDKVKPFTGYIRWALIHDTIFCLRTGIFILVSFMRMMFLARKHPLLDFEMSWARIKGTTIYPSFVKEARKILKNNPHLHAIIFGHTHVLRYRQWGGGKEYFNTGTWNEVTSLDIADFGLQTLLTYGFIELPPMGSNQRARIRLKEWKGQWLIT